MLAAILQTADTLTTAVPSFSVRFNFAIPLVVVLIILMFFLLLKSYTFDHPESEEKSAERPRKSIR
jgi:hypothetical protein